MKLKVEIEYTEQNNVRNAHRKYTIRGSNGTYHLLLLFMVFLFLCSGCYDG